MTSLLSCRVGMKGIRELLDGKIWEWDLSFRWEWEWDGNGDEVIEMGGNWYEKSVPAHLYSRPTTASRPSNPLNPSLLALQIRLLLTNVRVLALLGRIACTQYG